MTRKAHDAEEVEDEDRHRTVVCGGLGFLLGSPDLSGVFWPLWLASCTVCILGLVLAFTLPARRHPPTPCPGPEAGQRIPACSTRNADRRDPRIDEHVGRESQPKSLAELPAAQPAGSLGTSR